MTKKEDKLYVDVNIDPYKTSVADLLSLAAQHPSGTICIRGADDSGINQWGLVITFGDNSDKITDALETTLISVTEKLSKAEEVDRPVDLPIEN